jgi:alkaline phosphatase
MRYVDAFVIAIKKKNLKTYKKMATVGCKVWMDHGALEYYECIGDNLKNDWSVPFTKLLKLKSDETAIFSWIVYKSKAHCNAVNKKVMADPRMNPENFNNQMPVDMKRFTAGKFKTVAYKGEK